MNRKDLIDELSQRFEGNRVVAAQALDSVVDVITRSVSAGEKVVVSGLGEFERKAREAGEKAGDYVPEFKPGKELREVVSGAREWRARVNESLAVVPATAAGAAGQASRATASTLRGVAEKARELAAELSSIGEADGAATSPSAQAGTAAASEGTATKAPAEKTTATKSSAKSAAKKASTAKKAPAKNSAATKTAGSRGTAQKSTATKSSAAKSTATSKSTATKKGTATEKDTATKSSAKKTSATKSTTSPSSAGTGRTGT